MDAQTAIKNSFVKANRELTVATMDLTDAMNHLQELLTRVRRDTDEGRFYDETNLATATAEVIRLNAHCAAKKEQKEYAEYMYELCTGK